ncbi:MAG: hypothetical protein GY920_12310, partial [Aliivibrio sp.]|nr:hypothetical protein [Aliivibrio sp.]
VDFELIINKADFTKVVLGETTLEALFKSGQAGVKGDASLLEKLAGSLDNFDGMFEILPMPSK